MDNNPKLLSIGCLSAQTSFLPVFLPSETLSTLITLNIISPQMTLKWLILNPDFSSKHHIWKATSPLHIFTLNVHLTSQTPYVQKRPLGVFAPNGVPPQNKTKQKLLSPLSTCNFSNPGQWHHPYAQVTPNIPNTSRSCQPSFQNAFLVHPFLSISTSTPWPDTTVLSCLHCNSHFPGLYAPSCPPTIHALLRRSQSHTNLKSLWIPRSPRILDPANSSNVILYLFLPSSMSSTHTGLHWTQRTLSYLLAFAFSVPSAWDTLLPV